MPRVHDFLNNKINFVSDGLTSATIIREELNKQKPSMIARFGSTEIKALIYPKIPFFIKPFLKKRVLNNMYNLSGFFPSTIENINRFSKLIFDDIKMLDVLASWRIEENVLQKNLSHVKKIKLRTLEPYFSDDPWSAVLEDKNVLVVHPFDESIEKQYLTKRELLFKDPRVLPEFKSLQTIKSVQTIAGNKSSFKDWFEALDYMKMQISNKKFDIAIIGCGAYGFPLAAHVKRMGKKAIHLGGPTQILFGIKGKRWENNPDFKDIINEHFIRPSINDTPQNAAIVEDGCYW